MKQRIAVWLHGGIGTGEFSQGVPMLERILTGLAEDHTLIVYSQSTPNDDFVSKHFVLRSPPSKVKSTILRWLILVKYFREDNKRKSVNICLSFWGYPAGMFVVLLGKLLTIPSIVYLQGGDAVRVSSIGYGVFHKPVTRKIATWTYNNASILIAMSKYQRDWLQHYGIRRTIHVIPWGVDPLLYPFQFKTRNAGLNVIHVGHLSPVKDQTTLLRAFARIVKRHPAKLKIFGVDAGSKAALQNLCTQLNITSFVEFRNMVPYGQMPEHYRWADLMLHTSLSEGQSMALTEAASTGVLLAGTNVGLLYDLGEEYGITVEPGDYKSLSDKVIEILSDQKNWNKKVLQARSWSELHTLQWSIGEIKKLLDSCKHSGYNAKGTSA